MAQTQTEPWAAAVQPPAHTEEGEGGAPGQDAPQHQAHAHAHTDRETDTDTHVQAVVQAQTGVVVEAPTDKDTHADTHVQTDVQAETAGHTLEAQVQTQPQGTLSSAFAAAQAAAAALPADPLFTQTTDTQFGLELPPSGLGLGDGLDGQLWTVLGLDAGTMGSGPLAHLMMGQPVDYSSFTETHTFPQTTQPTPNQAGTDGHSCKRRPSLFSRIPSTPSEDEQAVIRVGTDYQAAIPDILRGAADTDECPGSVAVWEPSDEQDGGTVRELIRAAMKEYRFQVREDQFLALLYWNRYDMDKTVRDLTTITIADPTKRPDLWSMPDRTQFEEGLAKFGKNFLQIQKQYFPERSVSSVVAYYYHWKNIKRRNANPSFTGARKRAYEERGDWEIDEVRYLRYGRGTTRHPIKKARSTNCSRCGAPLLQGRLCDNCGSSRHSSRPPSVMGGSEKDADREVSADEQHPGGLQTMSAQPQEAAKPPSSDPPRIPATNQPNSNPDEKEALGGGVLSRPAVISHVDPPGVGGDPMQVDPHPLDHMGGGPLENSSQQTERGRGQ